MLPLLLLAGLADAALHAQGFLHTDGPAIVNEAGEEVIFRGFGLGGWMLQEGYMLGTGGPQHELEARIEALVGPERKAEFYDAWLANHTRKIDVDSLAAWGYNLIRLPMHYKLFTPPIEEEPVPGEITWREEGFTLTDSLLEWCKANDLYLILDMHAAPGGQGENADISDYDPTKPSLWESADNRAKMVALWRRLAERYADEPMIAGYDLINEPNWGFQNHATDPNGCAETQNTPLWNLQIDITQAIREVDTNHIVIIEGNCWGGNYAGLPALWDDKLVISYHKYWNANDQGSIQGMLNMRANRNVPIWLGETGENSNTWFTEAIALFESNDIGWAWWPLKKLGFNNPLEVPRNPGYQQILNYWHGSGPQPSEDAAYAALMQLADDLRLENNLYHPDVVDAMIRQPHSDEAIPYHPHHISAGDTTTIFATDFDLGRHEVAYGDNEVQNTSGGSGGPAWNQGYTYRNDGVDIEPCEDTLLTNGYNVGWIETDEWLQYTVEVETAGLYQLNIRGAAVGVTGKISLLANGIPVTPVVPMPFTGGYQNWETTTVAQVPLDSGRNVLRLAVETGGFNLNYLSFSGPLEAGEAQPVLLKAQGTHGQSQIDLIFNQDFAEPVLGANFSVTYAGEAVAVNEVSLADGRPRIISLRMEAPLQYGTEVLVSYLDESINTVTGVVLDSFFQAPVEIVLEGELLPLHVPGRVEVEDFTVNNGFSFEETTDTGGGLNAGYTDTGDYLDFLVYVEQTGLYEVGFRVASQSVGAALRLQLLDGGDMTTLTTANAGPTGGWQIWTTVTREIILPQGIHAIRLRADGSLFNINWMDFAFLSEVSDLAEVGRDAGVTLFPNPNTDTIHLRFSEPEMVPAEVTIYDMQGRRKLSLPLQGSPPALSIPHQLAKGTYLLLFEQRGRRVARKFVVQ